MSKKFAELNLKPELLESLKILNFKEMTPIQEESLPCILESKDVIAQAKTGSGKTAAFGLGLLESLDLTNENLQGLIICPTRELAEQVANQIRKLSSALANVKVLSLCGGVPESVQEKSLIAKPHIAVGTPGRILQLLDKGALSVAGLKTFILDEADRMLDMGFTEEITEIIKRLPNKKQSLLFSATYPEDIIALSKTFQNDPVIIKVDTKDVENKIKDVFYEVRPTQDKNNLLYKILSQFKPERTIVFCRTKKETADVADFLSGRNIFCECLNGDLEQRERTEVLTLFSNRSLSVLVATDVAARGLDIKDLNAVINYNMPSGADNYVHRIGRTGRAGKEGLAFSFYNKEEDFRLNLIEELTGNKCVIEDATKLSYSEKFNLIPPMKTIYISGGKKDKLRPGDIVGALTGEAKLSAKDIGDINVQPSFSFVAIKKSRAKKAVESLSKGRIKKKKYKVGFVRN